MIMKNSDMPAMPQSFSMSEEDCGTTMTHIEEAELSENIGLTKREYFAAKVMQGLLAQSNGSAISSDKVLGAKYCVDMADELLKALEE
jgi:hypothetical protein